MPVEVPVAKQKTNAWVPGWFIGAKTVAGDAIKLCFKLTDGTFADQFFRGEVPQATLDNLRRANGLEPEKFGDFASLPAFGETESMGYNKLIEIFVVQKDKYLNVRDVRPMKGDKSRHEDPFKKSGGASKDPFSPPDDGEDDPVF